jgi:hypothetical protein
MCRLVLRDLLEVAASFLGDRREWGNRLECRGLNFQGLKFLISDFQAKGAMRYLPSG